jgi:hypothetical protein
MGSFNKGGHSNAISYDDDRRGAYVNHHARSDQMPVNYNRQAASDIGPTMPGARVNNNGG